MCSTSYFLIVSQRNSDSVNDCYKFWIITDLISEVLTNKYNDMTTFG